MLVMNTLKVDMHTQFGLWSTKIVVMMAQKVGSEVLLASTDLVLFDSENEGDGTLGSMGAKSSEK